MITFKINTLPSVADVIDLYHHCALGERRPIDDPARIQLMIENANLVITAWLGEKLVGIARCMTDFTYVTYLADLAVHGDYQKQGIGKQLIQAVREHTEPCCKIVLLAAPSALGYYEQLNFTPHNSAWTS